MNDALATPSVDPQARSHGALAPAKVADRIAQTLAAYGVRFAFGIPGNDVLEIIGACEEQCIRFVLAKSEPSAAFMADAVYHLTGQPAALIPALGPGIANAISGIAGAAQERSAMVVLTGEMATPQQGIYTHQVFDHVALATPVTKYAATLNAARAAQQTAKALDIALAHPPGPVMLNIPADVARAPSTEARTFAPPRRSAPQLAEADIARLRGMLAQARHPLALIGRAALQGGASEAVGTFLNLWGMPFLTTYKAKGIVSESDPLSLGALGLSPVIDAENLRLIADADLLVLIGFDPIELRDAWLDAWDEAKPCISVDWVSANHRVFPLGEEALGDVPRILTALAQSGRGGNEWPPERLAAHRSRVTSIVRPRAPKNAISPAALFGAVSRRVAPDWLLTVDVGAHRILANHVLHCLLPGQLLQSNGLGHMGYALPSAIAAQLVHPTRTVVALLGDGCLLMTTGDLALAAELDLPIVVVVLNDDALSLIKLKQSKMQLEPRAVDFRSPRFDRVAEGFGAVGRRVTDLAAFEVALDKALAARRFTVIDAVVDPAEYLEQM
jgi:acetolactate synthase-1/2/3 large subunit